MAKAYSTKRMISLFILLTTLGISSALLLYQITPTSSPYKVIVIASPEKRYQSPIPSGTDERQSFYIDDISVYNGKELVFSDVFDFGSLEEYGWTKIRNATIQRDCSYSPSYSLVLRYSGQGVACAYHQINIGWGWETVSYTAFVMVSELKPEYQRRHTNLFLYSDSGLPNLAGGVIVDSSGKAHVWLFINYVGQTARVQNDSVTLDPYRWYGVSLVVSKPSKQVELYIDGDLAAKLPLDISGFQTFNEISVWGWIP